MRLLTVSFFIEVAAMCRIAPLRALARRPCLELKQGHDQHLFNPQQALAMYLFALEPVCQPRGRQFIPCRGTAADHRQSSVRLLAMDKQANVASDASQSQASVEPSTTEEQVEEEEKEEDHLVQFVVIRRDLLKVMGWPVGSVISQACHASTAVLFTHRDDEHVIAYHRDLLGMHKVVKECKGETQLLKLAEDLRTKDVIHHLWVEQPENIPTAIALKPYPKSFVVPLLKKYSLFK